MRWTDIPPSDRLDLEDAAEILSLNRLSKVVAASVDAAIEDLEEEKDGSVRVTRGEAAAKIVREVLGGIRQTAPGIADLVDELGRRGWELVPTRCTIRNLPRQRTESERVADRFAELIRIRKSDVVIPTRHPRVKRLAAPLPPPKKTELDPTDPDDAVAYAAEILDLLDRIETAVESGDLPSGAAEFADGVRDRVEGISEWVDSHSHVTEKQSDALRNMRSAVERWTGRIP